MDAKSPSLHRPSHFKTFGLLILDSPWQPLQWLPQGWRLFWRALPLSSTSAQQSGRNQGRGHGCILVSGYGEEEGWVRGKAEPCSIGRKLVQRHKTEREIAIETRKRQGRKTLVGILIILISLRCNSCKYLSPAGIISPQPGYRCAWAQTPADGRIGSWLQVWMDLQTHMHVCMCVNRA